MVFQNILFATFLALLTLSSTHAETASSNRSVTDTIQGTVTNILKTSGYTYAEVDNGTDKVWAAGPVTPLKIGDTIGFSTRMPMKNFHSKSMKRDFSVVYFVDQFILDNNAAPSLSHNKIKPKTGKPVEGIDKVKNGNTITEIYTNKNKLSDKNIRVRGQVVKYTANIMGKNWLHIKDSSSTQDLTITTADTASIDDVIIIEGKLELNKDYGYGYLYPVIVTDAGIIKE